VQNIEIRVVWGGYRSVKVIDNVTVRSNSYHFLFDFNRSYMRLSCTVFETYPVICRKSPILIHPTCIWRPLRGWPRSNFAEIFCTRKVDSLGYRVVSYVWSCILRFWYNTSLWQTDRQTYRQTDGRTDWHTTAYAALAQRRAVKSSTNFRWIASERLAICNSAS